MKRQENGKRHRWDQLKEKVEKDTEWDIKGCFQLNWTWQCWNCVPLWLHRAGVLFHRHLSAKHNICSIMSRWTEVISVLPCFWGETRLLFRVWKSLEFKASPSRCPWEGLCQASGFKSGSSEDNFEDGDRKSLNSTTELSLFGPKMWHHSDMQLNVSKSSRGLVLLERSGRFRQHTTLIILVLEPQESKPVLPLSPFHQSKSLLGSIITTYK